MNSFSFVPIFSVVVGVNLCVHVIRQKEAPKDICDYLLNEWSVITMIFISISLVKFSSILELGCLLSVLEFVHKYNPLFILLESFV